jgi:lipopolysaccharide/colanic/teichoic acid biosynthesis glycosyltransferase
MYTEADQALWARAQAIMACEGGPKGADYFKSPLKRWLDLVGVGSLGTVLSPLILLGAAAVMIQDRDQPIYTSIFTNPGTGEKVKLWKFRSMVPDAHTQETELIKKGKFYLAKDNGTDHRVTPVGKVIRKTSIDELPQLGNVLKGDLSLVGPRYYVDTEWRELILVNGDPDLIEDFKDLLGQGLKFGATGLGVVLARNSQSPLLINQRLTLNVLYGQQANFMADLKIIALTSTVLSKGK